MGPFVSLCVTSLCDVIDWLCAFCPLVKPIGDWQVCLDTALKGYRPYALDKCKGNHPGLIFFGHSTEGFV